MIEKKSANGNKYNIQHKIEFEGSFGWKVVAGSEKEYGRGSVSVSFTRDTDMPNYASIVSLENEYNACVSKMSKSVYFMDGNKIKCSSMVPGVVKTILIILLFLLVCVFTVERSVLMFLIVDALLVVLSIYLTYSSKNKFRELNQNLKDILEKVKML